METIVIYPDFDDVRIPRTKHYPKDYNWWYLDGKIENIVGYDKGTIIYCPERFLKDGVVYINEIVNVICIGITEPCIGYFKVQEEEITSEGKPKWCQRGYVNLKSDKDAREHSLKQWKGSSYLW